jgi:glycerol kinase
MQAQADLLQAPVELYPSPDATALGVGALARLGSGAASTPGDAVGDWKAVAVFEPRMGAEEAAERLARWEAAALRLADLSRSDV